MKKILLLIIILFNQVTYSVTLTDIQGGTITNNIVMNVPSEYATVQDALSTLEGKKSLTVQLLIYRLPMELITIIHLSSLIIHMPQE